jgi:hypothetical protein
MHSSPAPARNPPVPPQRARASAFPAPGGEAKATRWPAMAGPLTYRRPGADCPCRRGNNGARAHSPYRAEELRSRCMLLQRATGGSSTLVTGDLGMQLRADAHGLGHAEMPDKYAKDARRRPSFTWVAWSRLNKTSPRTWSTGSERNRRTSSLASSQTACLLARRHPAQQRPRQRTSRIVQRSGGHAARTRHPRPSRRLWESRIGGCALPDSPWALGSDG